jgi:hypothetical protein
MIRTAHSRRTATVAAMLIGGLDAAEILQPTADQSKASPSAERSQERLRY